MHVPRARKVYGRTDGRIVVPWNLCNILKAELQPKSQLPLLTRSTRYKVLVYTSFSVMLLLPPGHNRRPQDNSSNCRGILRYLPVDGIESERFIANLRADQALLRLVNAKYRPVFVQPDPALPGFYRCNNCEKILDCPLPYGFHKVGEHVSVLCGVDLLRPPATCHTCHTPA